MAGPVVLTIARLEINKRPFDAIQVVREVRETIPDVELVWVGDGMLAESVRRVAPSFAHFVGAHTGPAKARYLRECSAYLSTSVYEGFNITLGEALLLRKPAVAYGLPVYRDVYERYVIYVSVGDTNEAARALTDVLLNPAKYGPLVEAGARFVEENYSPRAVARRIEKALMEAVTAD